MKQCALTLVYYVSSLTLLLLFICKIASIYITQLFEYQHAISRVKSIAFAINLLYYHIEDSTCCSRCRFCLFLSLLCSSLIMASFPHITHLAGTFLPFIEATEMGGT